MPWFPEEVLEISLTTSAIKLFDYLELDSMFIQDVSSSIPVVDHDAVAAVGAAAAVEPCDAAVAAARWGNAEQEEEQAAAQPG